MESTSADFASEHNQPPPPDVQTIQAADEALSNLVQGALDELGTALTQTEQYASAVIKDVTDGLKKHVKQTDKQAQGILENVIAELLATLETGQALSESLLAPIINHLNATGVQLPPPQAPMRPLTVVPTEVIQGIPPPLTSTPYYPLGHAPLGPGTRGPSEPYPPTSPFPSPAPPSPGAPFPPSSPGGGVLPLPSSPSVSGPPAPTIAPGLVYPPLVPGEPPRPGEVTPPPPSYAKPPPEDTHYDPSATFPRAPESGVEPPASGAPEMPGDTAWNPMPHGGEVCPAACEGGDPIPAKTDIEVAGAGGARGGPEIGVGCGDWCEDMQDARDAFAQIGRRVLDKSGVKLNQTTLDILAHFARLNPPDYDEVIKAFDIVMGDNRIIRATDDLMDASSIHYPARGNVLRELLACRALFDTIGQFGVSASQHGGYTKGSSLGVGGGIGIGGGGAIGLNAQTGMGRSTNSSRGSFSSASISVNGNGTVNAGISEGTASGQTLSTQFAFYYLILPLSSVLDACIQWAMPTSGLSTGDAVALWVRGRITEQHAKCVAEFNGDSWCEARLRAYTNRAMLSPQQAIYYARRVGAKALDAQDYLHHLGYQTQQERDALLLLYNRQNTEAEYLAYHRSGAADNTYSLLVNPGEGFEEYWRLHGDELEAQGLRRPVVENIYRAGRWNVPGLNDRRTMLWRLRPGVVPNALEFSEADYHTALAADAMPQYWRQRMDAIKYRVPQYRQLLSLLDAGAATLQEIKDVIRDEGFGPEWADRIGEYERVASVRRHQAEIEGWTPARISAAYGRNCLDADGVRHAMRSLAYSDADADALMQVSEAMVRCHWRERWREKAQALAMVQVERTYKDGFIGREQALAALEAAGASRPAGVGIMEAWGLEVHAQHNASARRAVKKGWESGYVGSDAAVALLVGTEMSQQRATEEVREWEAEHAIDQRIAGATETLRLMSEALITPGAAAARLHALGWEEHEAELLLQEASNKLRAMQIRSESVQTASARRAANASEKLVMQARRTHQQAVSELRRLTPVASLKSWLKKGIISDATFRKRMIALAYTHEVIDLMIEEVCNAKNAKCVETNGAGEPGGGNPGDGGSGSATTGGSSPPAVP